MFATKFVCNGFAERIDISYYDYQLSKVGDKILDLKLLPWATSLVFNGKKAVCCQLTSKAGKLSLKTEPVNQYNNTS